MDDERDLSHLNCPFATADDYLLALRLLGSDPLRKPAPLGRDRDRQLTPLERLFLPRGPYTANDVEQAKSLAYRWEDYGFTRDHVRAWLDGGLGQREADLAALLVEEGITPDRLTEECCHRKTRERLLLIDVARLMPQTHVYEPDKEFWRLLDEWSVVRDRRAALVPRSAALWERQRPTA